MPDTPNFPPADNLPDLLNLPLPFFYSNGFVNGASAVDVTTIWTAHDKPVANCTFSWSVAKSYAQALKILVEKFEHDTGQTIMTTFDIQSKIASNSSKRDAKENESE